MTITLAIPWVLALASLAQTPPGGRSSDSPDERLKFMKESVRSYEVNVSGERGTTSKIQSEPAFRLGRQGADTLIDGAIFLWTDDTGRPNAAIQMFAIPTEREPEGLWIHEFTSLATKPLTVEREGRAVWSPARAGLEFKPLEGAPVPAATPSQRLRQMHALTREFQATDNFGGRGWTQLRILSKEIARYGKPDSEILDGALFAFVLGTDPEVFLFLEERQGEKGPEWQYAVAPMTVYALRVSRKDQVIWAISDRTPANDPSRPFYDTTYRP